jgi:hypothetical protein
VPDVTTVAGFISYAHGKITILDRDELESALKA